MHKAKNAQSLVAVGLSAVFVFDIAYMNVPQIVSQVCETLIYQRL